MTTRSARRAAVRPNQGDVAAFVASRPAGTRAADVAAALGMSESTARSQLGRLAEAGKLQRGERGLYLPAERGSDRPPRHLSLVRADPDRAERDENAANAAEVKSAGEVNAAVRATCPFCYWVQRQPDARQCEACGYFLVQPVPS